MTKKKFKIPNLQFPDQSDELPRTEFKKKIRIDLPDRDRKLYRALFEINGELPDIITVESESEW